MGLLIRKASGERPGVITAVLALLALLLWSSCFLVHDYDTCTTDANCPFTHRCVDGLCRPRPEYPPCDPRQAGNTCPLGTTCDPTLAVCRPPDHDAGTDDSDRGGLSDIEGEIDTSDDVQDDRPVEDTVDDPECLDHGDCTNHEFCDGEERCVEGVCQSAEAVEVSDGWWCTIDRCDEEIDEVIHDPRDLRCRDDNLCSLEQCAPEFQNTDDGSGCYLGPIGDGTVCGEGQVCRGIECVLAGCGNAVVEIASGEECDDGNLTNADGCDQTCHWEPRRLDLEAGMSAPDQVITGIDPQDEWGTYMACGDIDGDGVGDLVLWTKFARGRSNLAPDTVPEIRVVFGPLPDEGNFALADISGWVLYGTQSDWYTSLFLADVNDDDLDDVVFSSSNFHDGSTYSGGAVWIYFGSPGAGDLVREEEITASSADIAYYGRNTSQRLSAEGIADFDGDGATDILFHLNQEDIGALVLLPSPTSGRYHVPPVEPALILVGEVEFGGDLGSGGLTVVHGELAGQSHLFVSDLAAARSAEDPDTRGRHYLVPLPLSHGGQENVTNLASLILVNPPGTDRPHAGPAFDLSGDGLVDLTIEMKTSGELSPLVYAVSTASLGDSPVFLSNYSSAGIGIWIPDSSWATDTPISQIDFTEDGRDDLVILTQGAALHPGYSPSAGRAFIFPSPVELGSLVDLERQHAPLEIWGGAGDGMKSLVRCDIDGDGQKDTILGLTGEGSPGTQGTLWVYHSIPWSLVVE